ncbi:MAG: type II toxin-antitoxin system MqsA family antitoxin [Hyphomonadaceae bacterium]|nr:type II toxin-antitoxin system MqsA family antitoxin [Hyphomonadaceae bacterium]
MSRKSAKRKGTIGKDAQRIIDGLNEALAIVEGRADPKTYRVHVPVDVDVEKIRKKLKLTQAQFAFRYGFSVGAIRDWEQKRKEPEASARMFLKVIEKRPDVVAEVLGK